MAALAPSGAQGRPPGRAEGVDGIGPELRSLVETYVSYLSGCDACVIEALRAAHALDADPSRLRLLSTWRRAPLRTYTDRERIALVWAEVVAVMDEAGIGETLRRQASESFSAGEMDALTRTVLATRGYRRLVLERAGGTRSEPPWRSRPAAPCLSRAGCELCVAP